MKGMLVVLQSDLRDIVHSRGFLIITAIIGVLTVGVAVGVPISLNRWLATGLAWEKAKPMLELFMGLAVNYVPLIALFSCMSTWATDPIAKEKAKGPIESLLATPLTAKAVWIGKSLSILPTCLYHRVYRYADSYSGDEPRFYPAEYRSFCPPATGSIYQLFLSSPAHVYPHFIGGYFQPDYQPGYWSDRYYICWGASAAGGRAGWRTDLVAFSFMGLRPI